MGTVHGRKPGSAVHLHKQFCRRKLGTAVHLHRHSYVVGNQNQLCNCTHIAMREEARPSCAPAHIQLHVGKPSPAVHLHRHSYMGGNQNQLRTCIRSYVEGSQAQLCTCMGTVSWEEAEALGDCSFPNTCLLSCSLANNQARHSAQNS